LPLGKGCQGGKPAQSQRNDGAAKVPGIILHEKQVCRGPKLGSPERLETDETIEIHHGQILFR
jgi:hypothetical protein